MILWHLSIIILSVPQILYNHLQLSSSHRQWKPWWYGHRTSSQRANNSDVEWWNRHTWKEGWVGGQDGRLMRVHTEPLTWPASSRSAGGFPGAPGRCGRGKCCGPPAPACWAGSEASRPAAPSSSCAEASLMVSSAKLRSVTTCCFSTEPPQLITISCQSYLHAYVIRVASLRPAAHSQYCRGGQAITGAHISLQIVAWLTVWALFFTSVISTWWCHQYNKGNELKSIFQAALCWKIHWWSILLPLVVLFSIATLWVLWTLEYLDCRRWNDEKKKKNMT